MTFAARTLAASGGGSRTKYTGTITQGFYYDGSYLTYYGFDTGAGGAVYGSRSPTTVNGNTFASLYDIWIGATAYNSLLYITGFSSDPGVDFITSVTVGTATQYPVVGYYSYSAGTANWGFASTFGFASSGTISCTMTGI